jgi:hypothetical protein
MEQVIPDTVAACRTFCNRLGQENPRNTAEQTIAPHKCALVAALAFRIPSVRKTQMVDMQIRN